MLSAFLVKLLRVLNIEGILQHFALDLRLAHVVLGQAALTASLEVVEAYAD